MRLLKGAAAANASPGAGLQVGVRAGQGDSICWW